MAQALDWVMDNTMPGQVMLQSWLTQQGVDRKSSWHYLNKGWFTRLDHGVYYRTGKTPDWVDAVQCLQKQWSIPVHVAGLTSLTQQGQSHYLEITKPHIWLSVPLRAHLMSWLKRIDNVTWTQIISRPMLSDTEDYLTSLNLDGRTVVASNLELAAYEVVSNIPKHITISHADELFQGLNRLSPKKMKLLLSASTHIKTNRILLYLAHRNGHQWVKFIDEADIELGTGTRQVVEGGKLDQQYKITVPNDFMDEKSYG